MPSIPRTSRREHLMEILEIKILMYEKSKSQLEINENLKLAESTFISIIHHHNR